MVQVNSNLNKTSKEASSKTLYQSFASLPKRTRLIIGLSGIAFALAGSYISDKLEEKFPSEDKVDLFKDIKKEK